LYVFFHHRGAETRRRTETFFMEGTEFTETLFRIMSARRRPRHRVKKGACS
jgi:hypothetical protein